MPTLRIMYWNIQNLGVKSSRYRGDYAPLFNFVAAAAALARVNLISIMEVRQGAVPLFNNLRAALNAAYQDAHLPAAWHYDWIPGAVGIDTPDDVAINNVGQLGWSLFANNEGYAVFWNQVPDTLILRESPVPMSGGVTTDLAGHALDAARARNHVLSLVLEGRQPLAAGPDGLPRASNFAPGHAPPWTRLNFPPAFTPVPSYEGTRRPCYCYATFRAQIGGGAQNFTIPILTYHAPSTVGIGAPQGTRRAAFSRQVYQVETAHNVFADCAQVIVGGDFNVDNQVAIRIAYDGFLNDFAHGGAQCNTLLNQLWGGPYPIPRAERNRHFATTVRIANRAPGGVAQVLPIPGAADDDTRHYRSLAIDNVFYGGFTIEAGAPFNASHPRGFAWDLIAAVMEPDSLDPATLDPGIPANLGPGCLREAPILGFLEVLVPTLEKYENRGADNEPVDGAGDPVFPFIHDWETFIRYIESGTFETARQAAELIRLFVSDHLPVVFDFDLP